MDFILHSIIVGFAITNLVLSILGFFSKDRYASIRLLDDSIILVIRLASVLLLGLWLFKVITKENSIAHIIEGQYWWVIGALVLVFILLNLLVWSNQWVRMRQGRTFSSFLIFILLSIESMVQTSISAHNERISPSNWAFFDASPDLTPYSTIEHLVVFAATVGIVYLLKSRFNQTK